MAKKIPIIAATGVALFAMNAYANYASAGGGTAGLNKAAYYSLGIESSSYYSGAPGGVDIKQTIKGVSPLIVGIGGSMLASKLKMNRYISSIPFFKM